MSGTILVVGSANTDMSIKLDRIPRPGETVLGGELDVAQGGKGANQAVAAARAGGRVTLVARLGRDMFGDQALEGYRAEGIDVGFVSRDPDAPSGVALICVDAGGENSIAVAGGANARLSPADLASADPAFADAGLLLLQLETPMETVLAAATRASSHGVRTILNPAPARDLPDDLLQQVSILTPNEIEAEQLTEVSVSNIAGARAAAAALRNRGATAVVITLGEQGALVVEEDRDTHLPGFPVTPVDTVGAGDVFNGALAVAVAEGRPLVEAARFANAAAALAVTRRGAQPAAPTRAEIETQLRA